MEIQWDSSLLVTASTVSFPCCFQIPFPCEYLGDKTCKLTEQMLFICNGHQWADAARDEQYVQTYIAQEINP